MELWQYDATDLARLIRTGQASAREAVDLVLGRLHKVNPAINAMVRVLEAEARPAAETADAARARGHALPPLHGVPVTTKVNVDQAGLPTDNGVVPLKDFVAQDDSPVVANLKHAGAIIVGRTNAPAFSMRIFTDNALHGRTLNPCDPSVTPGGSSGGAGAATATGIGAIAHGNDIGGSVRIPAYCNGVVGLRTGFGRIPSFNPSAPAGRPIGAVLMAVQGPHTRTVRDARRALQAMARGDRRDWRWNDVPMQGPPPARPIKVAIVPEVPGGPNSSRPGRGGSAGRQAPASRGLRRRGGAAARHGARRRALAHDLRHRCAERPVAADAEDGRSRRHHLDEGLAGAPQGGRPADLCGGAHRTRRAAAALDGPSSSNGRW